MQKQFCTNLADTAYLFYHIYLHSYCGDTTVPEGVNHKLQHDVLDLSVQGRLPVPALESQYIHISSSSKVTQIQVIMKLETLCPAHTCNT